MATAKSSKSGRSRRSRRRQAGKWRHGGTLRVAALTVLAVILLFGFLFCIYLDTEIRYKFEGRRWSLPARVYARPLELFVGQKFGKADLLQELSFLNYRAGKDAPGTFRELPNVLLLRTRGFTFWDGKEPARDLLIRFDDGRISEILDNGTASELQLLRLEPAHIANIYPAQKEDRDLVRLEEVPPLLLHTLVEVEDQNFYGHHGVRPTSILRALVANIRAGEAVQGGSTLTQQLVKNFFLNNERTFRRKIIEAMMALLLELHYDKNEILEAYINEVYLGQEGEQAIHGFALGSRFYFDRALSDLSVEQVALLVGLVNGPSYLNPQKHPERARQRRDVVLNIMQARGLIPESVAQKARLSPLSVRPEGSFAQSSYPAFIDFVKRQLTTHYREEDLRSEGLRIFTTLDPLVQKQAERALSRQLDRLRKRFKPREAEQLQGAVVVTSVDTGEVQAVVADHNPRYAGYNRALDARRPVGSLVKPAVYLAALQDSAEFNPSTIIKDDPLQLRYPDGNLWEPANYDKQYHGEVPLFHGLVYSYNAATVRLGLQIGIEKVIAVLRKMGLPYEPPSYPSLLLGSLELSPLEVSQLYQTLASSGFNMPLRSVREVLTADGMQLTRYPLNVEQTLDVSVVHQVNRMLQMVVEFGTASQAGKQLPELQAAGKTGTTDDLRDSWFAGFTGQHLAVVWLGRDDNQPAGLSGASGALPVWIDLMADIDTRPLQLAIPQNVEYVWINRQDGRRSAAKCDNVTRMPFIIGTGPASDHECGPSWFKRLFD
ncbi:MAG TPA: penicillin-binding protein 1B [Gammaproteobacteria bacterium]|nr:penicillin-binding protein 1B [Gammaproteobacteria bacterium]